MARDFSNTLSLPRTRRNMDFKKFFFFFLTFIHFWGRDREREKEKSGEGQRKRETESEAGSRLWAVSTEPNTGLKLTNHKITAWVKVRCLTDWATQVLLNVTDCSSGSLNTGTKPINKIAVKVSPATSVTYSFCLFVFCFYTHCCISGRMQAVLKVWAIRSGYDWPYHMA